MELVGVLFFWSEIGTESGYWAFQDKEFIFPPTEERPHVRWSYDGFHELKNGDNLTVYSKDDPDKVIWTGIIKLKPYPPFSESAHGRWIHTDQEGIDRDTWTRWFMERYPAKLTKIRPRN